MFGYIRPMQGELKVRELERFKACYCGLCHTLGQKYGLISRFILNYDFVFLAMLLWSGEDELIIKRKRCIASPFRRKHYCSQCTALDRSAGYSVILTWWKLCDSIADEPFFRALPYRGLKLLLSGAYKKAAGEFPGFDSAVRNEIYSLIEYEKSSADSLDGAADKFALILKAAAPESLPSNVQRPMLELLYHLGRWIYIVDACDDYTDDSRAGLYNPVAARYPPQDTMLSEDSVEKLKTTVTHSNNLLCAAFELLPGGAWSGILSNIVYLGMPDTLQRVLDGTFRKSSGNGNDR